MQESPAPKADHEYVLAERLRQTEALLQEEVRKRGAAEAALQEYKKQLLNSFKDMPVIVFAMDRDGGLIFFNREFTRVTGFNAEEILSNPDALDLLLKTKGGQFFDTEATPDRQAMKEWIFKAKDGSEKIVAWSDIAESCPFADWTHWGVGVDITELKRMERLRQDVERIVQHDLKTPLGAVLGFSDLLLEDPDIEDEHRWILSRIKKSGERMLGMIENRLAISRIEEGAYVYVPASIDLMQIFDMLETEFASICKQKLLSIHYTINGGGATKNRSYIIEGAESLLENLFANLLKNALEASPEGGKVTVAISATEDEHIIDIHNRGAVPESIRERFFDRFATSGKAWGTGLGTYSALLITKTHGGNITFTTSETEGTHVFVFLPKA